MVDALEREGRLLPPPPEENEKANNAEAPSSPYDQDPKEAPKRRRWWQAKRDRQERPEVRTGKSGRPRRRASRTSAADAGEMVWALLGGVLINSGKDVPVGRIMRYQAPAAGEIIDEAIRDTVVDRLVQPFVRTGNRMRGASALFGLPLVVAVIERNPGAYESLEPVLRGLLAEYLVAMVPAAKKQKKREAEYAKALSELFPDLQPGQDPIGEMIATIFAEAPETVRSPEAEEAAAL